MPKRRLIRGIPWLSRRPCSMQVRDLAEDRLQRLRQRVDTML